MKDLQPTIPGLKDGHTGVLVNLCFMFWCGVLGPDFFSSSIANLTSVLYTCTCTRAGCHTHLVPRVSPPGWVSQIDDELCSRKEGVSSVGSQWVMEVSWTPVKKDKGGIVVGRTNFRVSNRGMEIDTSVPGMKRCRIIL